MNGKLEVKCYEVEKYVLDFRLTGMTFSATIQFGTEEEVLAYLEQRKENIVDYKIKKISHAVVGEKND